jgi:hypothetical protein
MYFEKISSNLREEKETSNATGMLRIISEHTLEI